MTRFAAISRTRATPVALSMLFFSLSLTACQNASHKQLQQEAEQEWGRVRSELKVRLAAQQLETGRVDEAVKTLVQAIRFHPGDATLHLLLARCHIEQGDLRAAVVAVEQSSALGNESADLAYTRGLIAEQQRRYDQALEHYARAASIDSTSVDYVAAVAEILIALGRVGDARSLIDEHVAAFDHDPKLLLLRAGACNMLDDLEQSAEDYAGLFATIGDNPWVAEQYGLTLTRLGRYAESLAVLRPLLDGGDSSWGVSGPGRPPSSAVIRGVATCYLGLANPRAARSLLDEHVQRNPEDARAWWLLAETSIGLNDAATTRRCLERGRRLAPDLPQWNMLRAYLAWNRGDLSVAGSILESTLSTHPDHAPAHCFLGEIRDQADALQRARAHYEAALRVDPDNPWARARLQRFGSAGEGKPPEAKTMPE